MSTNFQTIQVDGKDIDEGEILIKWWVSRFKENKNFLGVTIGGTGTGKSYFDIRALELYYKKVFNRQFPIENVCFSIPEAVKLIRSGKLQRGEFVIIEEAGVIINALDFQNKLAKFFTFVLQSFRSKNIGILFNVPTLSMLNKTARLLVHGVFQTTSIDRGKKKVITKVFYVQTNPMTGKQYHKYLRQKIDRRKVTVERIALSLPSSELTTVYEDRKEKFVNETADKLIDSVDDTKKDKGNPLRDLIKKYWNEGIRNHTEIARRIGVTQHTVSQNIKIMIQNSEISLENKENQGSSYK